MYILCNKVKNIIVDFDSIYLSTLINESFLSILRKISTSVNLNILNYSQGSKVLLQENFKLFATGFNEYELQKFLVENEMQPFDTIILTSSQDTVRIAHTHNISTILYTNTINGLDHKYLPDQLVTSEDYLHELLIKNNVLGNFNELNIQKAGGIGYVYDLGEVKHLLYNNIKANLVFGGRYFTSNDPRAYIHCLTQMILRLKNFKTYAARELAWTLKENLDITRNIIGDFDLITNVPAKPGLENHLDLLLTQDSMKAYRNKVNTKVLSCKKTYEKQKFAGGFPERAQNVLGAFESNFQIGGHVILVDDIFTSGSTTLECSKVLYENGAEKVTILPLAIMQSKSNAPHSNHIGCGDNDNVYRLNFKTSDGNPFWVCNGSFENNYNVIKELYLKQNTFSDFDMGVFF